MIETGTPSNNRHQEEPPAYPMEVTMPNGVTKLKITREMAIRALKHMDEYTMQPEDATRDDMLAYQYLMWKDTERF